MTIDGVTSERISATTNLNDFQAKLDAAFPGTVTVSRVADSMTRFNLRFGADGDQPPITATGYTGSAAAKGGNISEVAISLGGGDGVEFMVEAGDGGDALGNGKVAAGRKSNCGTKPSLDPDDRPQYRRGDGGDGRKTGMPAAVSPVAVDDHDWCAVDWSSA